MKRQHPCPHCFVNIGDDKSACPHCGKPNPYFDETASGERSGFMPHHPSATAGKCAYCESVLYSDEKICSHCGAANPNFVVHGGDSGSFAGGERAHGTTNASTGKCPYCGATVRSNERFCAACGSENPHFTEDTPRIVRDPKTIEELKEYCAERGMPLLRMRFFIGEDAHEPKAFGIFKDGRGNTIVYKNKADRSRAVRYEGPDEAYAVSEILSKLKEECRARGIDPDHSLSDRGTSAPRTETPPRQPKRAARRTMGAKDVFRILLTVFVFFLIGASLLGRCSRYLTGCVHCVSTMSGTYDSQSDWGSDSGSGWDWGDWDWGSDSDSGWDWDDSNDWDDWDFGDSDWDSDW